jgi:hypothetical protein
LKLLLRIELPNSGRSRPSESILASPGFSEEDRKPADFVQTLFVALSLFANRRPIPEIRRTMTKSVFFEGKLRKAEGIGAIRGQNISPEEKMFSFSTCNASQDTQGHNPFQIKGSGSLHAPASLRQQS